MIFLQNQDLFSVAKKDNNNNESSMLQLFYENY